MSSTDSSASRMTKTGIIVKIHIATWIELSSPAAYRSDWPYKLNRLGIRLLTLLPGSCSLQTLRPCSDTFVQTLGLMRTFPRLAKVACMLSCCSWLP